MGWISQKPTSSSDLSVQIGLSLPLLFSVLIFSVGKDDSVWHTVILKPAFISITVALARLLRVLPVIVGKKKCKKLKLPVTECDCNWSELSFEDSERTLTRCGCHFFSLRQAKGERSPFFSPRLDHINLSTLSRPDEATSVLFLSTYSLLANRLNALRGCRYSGSALQPLLARPPSHLQGLFSSSFSPAPSC